MADGSTAIAIREVSLEIGWPAVQPLLPAHYEELAKFKDLNSLEPVYAAYCDAKSTDSLLVLLAYDAEELVGYAVTFRTTSAHYSTARVARNDVIYVRPEYRKGMTGYRLIKLTRERAKARWNTQQLIWHTKPGTSMDLLMPRLGCEKLDHLWAERL